MHSPKAPRSLALHSLNRANKLEERMFSGAGLCSTHKNQVNEEILAFLKA